MNFPGRNTLKLTDEAVRQIIGGHLATLFGEEVLIKRVAADGRYNSAGLEIEFTTDKRVDTGEVES